MYQGTTVGVVVVAHNEEGLVGEVIDTLPAFVDRAYVIDDGSTDGTWDEIQRHAEAVNDQWTDPTDQQAKETQSDSGSLESGPASEKPRRDGGFDRPVVPIRHETNGGVGAALKTGYRRAYEDGIGVTVVMAGDGQMDPDECHRIVAPVAEGRAAYAKGNRLQDASLREEMPTWRLFGNTLLTILTKIASGYWKMMDPANGYTAISHEALDSIDIDEIYDDYGAAHDILIWLNVENMRLADVPLPASYGEEESGIKYSSFVPNLSVLLFRRFIWRLTVKYVVRDCHPFVLFYALGAAGGVAGVIELIRSAFDSDSGRTNRLLAGILSLLSGSLIVFGMVFDMLDNQDLEVSVDE